MKRMWMVAAALAAGLVGCHHAPKNTTPRSQLDDGRKEGEAQLIRDVAAVDNLAAVPVSGVGLVVGLDGTGGPAPAGYRAFLEERLKKRGVEKVREILDSPNHSVVLVSALIPAGARKGDPADVEVVVPPGGRATSLRGGYLVECDLFNYDAASRVGPHLTGGHGDKLLLGDRIARAEGPLMVGTGPKGKNPDSEDEEGRSERGARVWGGARCLKERPMYLVLNPGHQLYRKAIQIATRVNETFNGGQVGADKLADAKRKELVELNPPPQYRLNLPRFLRVVGLIPMDRYEEGSAYRRQLEEQLLDPATAVSAALRLEALGPGSAKALRPALGSSYPLVRFCAAEALAYLGDPRCAEELGRLAAEQPALRAYCLTALASLDEGACYFKLQELLSCPTPEVRYGAFRALRAMDERTEAARGEQLNKSFYLHRVAKESPGMVHLLSGRRAEVVVFGGEPSLVPGFEFTAGPEFTVTAREGDPVCTVSRFSVRRGRDQQQCSFAVADVVRTLAAMGGSYSDVCDLLNQADRCKALNCPLAVDALPKATSVQELAKRGREDPTFAQTTPDVLNAGGELGATPTLYDLAPPKTPRHRREAGADGQ